MERKHHGVVQILLKHRVGVNTTDVNNIIINNADADVNEANVNTINSAKRTPLHQAAQAGGQEIVQLLLSANADIEARAEDGNTALMLATIEEQDAVTKTLLEQGADSLLCHSPYPSALEIAMHEGRKAAVSLILEN